MINCDRSEPVGDVTVEVLPVRQEHAADRKHPENVSGRRFLERVSVDPGEHGGGR